MKPLVGELCWTVTAPCPWCGDALRIVAHKEGGTFIGCSSFPECRFRASRDRQLEEAILEAARAMDLVDRLARHVLSPEQKKEFGL